MTDEITTCLKNASDEELTAWGNGQTGFNWRDANEMSVNYTNVVFRLKYVCTIYSRIVLTRTRECRFRG